MHEPSVLRVRSEGEAIARFHQEGSHLLIVDAGRGNAESWAAAARLADTCGVPVLFRSGGLGGDEAGFRVIYPVGNRDPAGPVAWALQYRSGQTHPDEYATDTSDIPFELTRLLRILQRGFLNAEGFSGMARALLDMSRMFTGAAAGWARLALEGFGPGDAVAPTCDLGDRHPMAAQGLAGIARNEGRVVVNNAFRNTPLPDGHATIENILFAPVGDGERCVGILGLANKRGGFTRRDRRLALACGRFMAEVCDRFASDARLRDKESLHQAIFECALDGVILLNMNDTVVEANPSACAMLGYSRKELRGQNLERLFPPEDRRGRRDWTKERLTQTNTGRFLALAWHREGRRVPVEISLSPLNVGGRRLGLAIIRHLNELGAAGTQIALQARLLDMLGHGVIGVDRGRRVLEVNHSAARMCGCGRKQAMGREWGGLLGPDNRELAERLDTALTKGIPWAGETEIARLDGVRLPVFLVLAPIIWDRGEILGAICIARDMSEIRAKELQLQSALDEREVLLREVHHRIKNNLQIISSMINLHAMRVGDEYIRGVLRTCLNRIHAVAHVHETLYRSGDLAGVDLHRYVAAIARTQVMNIGGASIMLEFDAESETAYIPMATAVPVGLAVNELISNAFKHAFPLGKPGRIVVGIRSEGGEVTLRVRDNGIGLPEGFAVGQTDSLGLQLVVGLIERQLQGTVAFRNDGGAEFVIRFRPGGKD